MAIDKRFNPKYIFRWRHVQTVLPTLFRSVAPLPYNRIELKTKDADQLFVDAVVRNNKHAVIIIHGMEGNSERNYMRGMGSIMLNNKIDVFAMNMRGCGKMNRKKHFYNAGLISDVDVVMKEVCSNGSYESVFIIGFSLGGNVVLNYLHSEMLKKYSQFKAAAVVSVPINLESCAQELNRWYNRIYRWRFLKDFYKKIKSKEKAYPELDCDNQFKQIKTIQEYDDRFTAPLAGYAGYKEYYQSVSALNIIGDIEQPFMFISSLDDPFLEIDCFPIDQLKHKENVQLVITDKGGHVGFFESLRDKFYFHETTIADYFNDFL